MLPDSILHVADTGEILTSPIQFLARIHEKHGNLVAIRKNGPIFSRTPDCAGVIAAFGIENQRRVLSDIEGFTLPISAAEAMKLPQNLVNLNRSLHSMQGAEHATQKRALMATLNNIEPPHQAIWAALEETTAGWTGEPVELVKQIRELIFRASLRVLFGDGSPIDWHRASLLQAYFHLRREVTSARPAVDSEALEQLAAMGSLLDSEMRDFVRESCKRPEAGSRGLLGSLATQSGTTLSEDQVVGHMNIFFISTTEPVAVALSWVLLVLSQLPELRRELRNEVEATLQGNPGSAPASLNRLALLDSVINETLRLLPPNALMLRITTKPMSFDGIQLPAHCEVILSPFVSHRDKTCFPRPDEFLPGRWRGMPPSPFVYFPFGAGGHACVGRAITMDLLKTALIFLLPRFDVLLTEDQDLDWVMRIMLLPSPDPIVAFYPFHSQVSPTPKKAGAISGALAGLLNFQNASPAS